MSAPRQQQAQHQMQHRVQRRTLATLVGGQAFGGVGITIGVATAALLAEEVSGSPELAGLVQTAQVLGAALAAYVLARVMGRSGRRPGLALGYVVGTLGAALCVVAGVVSSYPLLIAAAVLLGATTAANSQSRYAATDLATADQRARHLSIVVWATTIGAVAGPNLAGPAGDLAAAWDIPELTGPFVLGAVGMAVAALVILVGLRPDPLLLARDLARGGSAAAPAPAVVPPASDIVEPEREAALPDATATVGPTAEVGELARRPRRARGMAALRERPA
ncbi:MFS transporter, partial [Nocardioides massiliensis]